MTAEAAPLWNSIHYKADANGKPIDSKTQQGVADLIEAGFPGGKISDLTRTSESISIEVNSRSPSEISGSTSSGDDDGWEDVEPDEERVIFKSLFDLKPFNRLQTMCEYDRDTFGFDLAAVRKRLNLEFHESIQLVNYVRNKATEGTLQIPEPQSKEDFLSDEYLKPVLEDDAVLFSLEDLDYEPGSNAERDGHPPEMNGKVPASDVQQYAARIAELENALTMSREAFLEERSNTTADAPAVPRVRKQKDVHDRFYFNSYATRDIHEEMLKDTARTDAYRDFIYDNKHLFEGKVVLDVGCGTGILSMMCARAGAKHVYAVDNSDIIDNAREITFVNGLQETVTCLRGMVEELTLPVDKVDVIVSEWMGYALLYEAMLDSVIFARDKWLSPGGLMIPSEISLHLALLSDPELIVDKSDFWSSVYGFDMHVMGKGVFDGAMIEVATPSVIPSDLSSPEGSNKILHLDLHTAAVSDLTFHKPFQLALNREIDALDGFVVWFDAIFGHPNAEHNRTVLSTGPLAKRTHWQQVKLVIDHGGQAATRLAADKVVRGSITYSRVSDEHRNLEITMQWSVEGESEKGTHRWKIDY